MVGGGDGLLEMEGHDKVYKVMVELRVLSRSSEPRKHLFNKYAARVADAWSSQLLLRQFDPFCAGFKT